MEAQIRKKRKNKVLESAEAEKNFDIEKSTTMEDSQLGNYAFQDEKIEEVIDSTGLPPDIIRKWLHLEGSKRGITSQEMDFQKMKDLLVDVLHETILLGGKI